ncbi:MAG: ATP-binding protein [Bacteroidales bacterium]|nr:ATP-binding protein [Bacteroidales bacterium]
MKKMPFIFGKSADSNNFTDREEESLQLERNFKSSVNTIIISPRRWGKTSLVENVTNKLKVKNKNIKICLMDVFNIRTEGEFYEYFAKEVLKASASRWEEMVANAKMYLSHLLPKISFSADGQSEISFGVDWKTLKKHPDEILNLPQSIAKAKNINLIVCIDEFQSIGEFPESLAFQRKLRAQWQHHHNVAYCLYSSKRTMLLNIFANSHMPFYKFGDLMFLEKISNEKWAEFIKTKFEESGKRIKIEQAEYLAQLVDNHSYYVQQLAQQSWLRTATSCNVKIIDAALQGIKNQLSLLFVGQIETLSPTQINFLKAIIDGVSEFSTQDNLRKYRLGSSANISKIKKTLSNREIIDIIGTDIEILDPIFKLWLIENYF